MPHTCIWSVYVINVQHIQTSSPVIHVVCISKSRLVITSKAYTELSSFCNNILRKLVSLKRELPDESCVNPYKQYAGLSVLIKVSQKVFHVATHHAAIVHVHVYMAYLFWGDIHFSIICNVSVSVKCDI